MPHHDQDLKGKKIKADPQDIPQPALASLTRFYTVADPDQRLGDIADRLAIILKELGATVRHGGGFIGHIKAFLSFTEGGSIGMSVVKDKVEHQPFDQSAENRISGFKLAVTAIVYSFASEELSRLLSLSLAVGLPESVCRPVQVETQNLKPIAPFGFNPSTRP
jgi:hypothetical protein